MCEGAEASSNLTTDTLKCVRDQLAKNKLFELKPCDAGSDGACCWKLAAAYIARQDVRYWEF